MLQHSWGKVISNERDKSSLSCFSGANYLLRTLPVIVPIVYLTNVLCLDETIHDIYIPKHPALEKRHLILDNKYE